MIQETNGENCSGHDVENTGENDNLFSTFFRPEMGKSGSEISCFSEFVTGDGTSGDMDGSVGGADVSAAFIRRKAAEVGARVDAALNMGLNGGGLHDYYMSCCDVKMSNSNSNNDKCERNVFGRVDLNKLPDPEEGYSDSNE
ncbi:hypothetical protein SAY86_016785 [Trapa natans]|uniref:Uncharacterized protein n=1 Tax=Trapa natans TaxID=22666 RepID=A0AAN7R6U8_TRANT|nr:hypothetical protein SAY86_016785 [Trapa natans]